MVFIHLDHVLVGGNFYSEILIMKTILEILLSAVCAFGIIKQILRIIWLYFPNFLYGSFLFKNKDSSKIELLMYYILAIVAMAYYIVYVLDKII